MQTKTHVKRERAFNGGSVHNACKVEEVITFVTRTSYIRTYRSEETMENQAEQSASITKEAVYEALKDVHDPEIPVSIVDLGLVYDVKIIDDWVGVKMTLTSPGCGMSSMIANNVRDSVKKIPGVSDADVRIVWQPQWSPAMMSPEAKKKLGWAG